jgi:23S rRNA pseudouridine2605 synthase
MRAALTKLPKPATQRQSSRLGKASSVRDSLPLSKPVPRVKGLPRNKLAPAETRTGIHSRSIPAETQKLHKLLAQAGLGSRREMEELIAAGQATINGKVAQIGDRVGSTDVVRVRKHVVHLKFGERLPRVLLYHKPEGEIVSRDDPESRPSVFDKLPQLRSSKWVSVGRLDYNTSGLLIFTTDGQLANRLTHPRFEIEREYAVRIMGRLTPEQANVLTTEVKLEDGPAKFDHLSDQGGEGSNHWYRVILKEGRNREVRRMFEAIGLTVSRLMRVRFGPINLPPRLKRGKSMELDEAETRRLLELVASQTDGKQFE